MKVVEHYLEVLEKLSKAKGQEKVALHEYYCGRIYNENNER